MREILQQIIQNAMKDAQSSGKLRLDPFPTLTFEVPKREGQGDLATPVAMGLASSEGLAPRKIAEILLNHLKGHGDFMEKVEVAGPGYINFYLKKAYWLEVLREILLKLNWGEE